MGYCDSCLSAGSVNTYGYCEICGAEHDVAVNVSTVYDAAKTFESASKADVAQAS
jgi:hypothetical protein